MIWPWSSSPPAGDEDDKSARVGVSTMSWNDSLDVKDWDQYKDARTWIPAFVFTTVLLGGLRIYRTYLRRIPSVSYVLPHHYHRRTIFGRVTSVGDGDGFHLYHTPGGRLAGWGWLRTVLTDKKQLRGQTIPIRIAGIDAPEGAHFGRPAQPHASEALRWLQSSILNRYVRARVYKRDQYERIVATVYLRRFFFFRRDIGLEMLRRGLATTYEAKTGAEFGGEAMEKIYRDAEAEAKKKKLGLWSALGGKGKGRFGLGKAEGKSEQPFETPRQFKERMRDLGKAENGGSK
ncbi:nuclease domain-containing protein [Diaporthe helianthi]|uniref:Probable endonuclease LCL3 n=1 Tax=Diaporthe helianthi TaxID=158607 RepID=A0A2P5HEF3_DIAHE|nr:nuclease domain-containing protein [Diaporthe helianthi]